MWSWYKTWMTIAMAMAKRSSCIRRQCGAVIVDPDNRIIATGYNGAPAGYPNETRTCDGYCERGRSTQVESHYHDCVAVHAEANALMFCDRRDREGGSIYVTSSICYDCAKLIANSGLSTVYMISDSGPDDHRIPERSVDFMRLSGLDVKCLDSFPNFS